MDNEHMINLLKACVIGLIIHTYGDMPREKMGKKLSNYGFTDEEVEDILTPMKSVEDEEVPGVPRY